MWRYQDHFNCQLFVCDYDLQTLSYSWILSKMLGGRHALLQRDLPERESEPKYCLALTVLYSSGHGDLRVIFTNELKIGALKLIYFWYRWDYLSIFNEVTFSTFLCDKVVCILSEVIWTSSISLIPFMCKAILKAWSKEWGKDFQSESLGFNFDSTSLFSLSVVSIFPLWTCYARPPVVTSWLWRDHWFPMRLANIVSSRLICISSWQQSFSKWSAFTTSMWNKLILNTKSVLPITFRLISLG